MITILRMLLNPFLIWACITGGLYLIYLFVIKQVDTDITKTAKEIWAAYFMVSGIALAASIIFLIGFNQVPNQELDRSGLDERINKTGEYWKQRQVPDTTKETK